MNRATCSFAAVLVIALAGPLSAQTSTPRSDSLTSTPVNTPTSSTMTPTNAGTGDSLTSPSGTRNYNGTNGSTTTTQHATTNHHRSTHTASNAMSDNTGAAKHHHTRHHKSLPRTASPLPAVAFSGFVTLALGTWLSRRRPNS